MQVVNGEDDVESGFRIKELFGARKLNFDGTEGVAFCIQVPGCVRASVVGDFNNWDGRVNQMRKIEYTDLFELFIPYDITRPDINLKYYMKMEKPIFSPIHMQQHLNRFRAMRPYLQS